MKTKIHAYHFDIATPADADAYKALAEQLRATPGRGHWMHSLSVNFDAGHYGIARKIDGAEITLETDFLYDNQWNTAPIEGVSDTGLRVFDWAEDYMPQGMRQSIKRGHYIDITPEMREVRRNIHKCGYCGAHEPAAKGYVFCPHCIGSEYLEAKDLPLTRMLPAGESFKATRAPLTDAERAYLLPLYREAQLHGNTDRDKARITKARADILRKAEKEIAGAVAERDGLLWLMDHGMKTDNVIYYSHTARFGFGWRKPVDAEYLSALLDIISEFPFPYDIKCADGRTLSGG